MSSWPLLSTQDLANPSKLWPPTLAFCLQDIFFCEKSNRTSTISSNSLLTSSGLPGLKARLLLFCLESIIVLLPSPPRTSQILEGSPSQSTSLKSSHKFNLVVAKYLLLFTNPCLNPVLKYEQLSSERPNLNPALTSELLPQPLAACLSSCPSASSSGNAVPASPRRTTRNPWKRCGARWRRSRRRLRSWTARLSS